MEKQRKFLIVLPLLVIPFLTMAFWALGGGKADQRRQIHNSGLDTDLPQAQFKQKERSNKMEIYQTAQRDSSQDGISPAFLRSIGMEDKSSGNDPVTSPDDQAQKIQAKLAILHKQLDEPGPASIPTTSNTYDEPEKVRQIRKMMDRASSEDNQADPEMRELSKMLDKIQAIQNPSAVISKPSVTEVAKPFRAIPAVIDGKQKVADGASVKLRLTDTATIRGQLLPKGQEIFGLCQITNQRLLLTIQNIRLDAQIVPVNLVVFSLDGMPGIPAPEAELAGAAGNGTENAIQSMQLLTMDQSLGVQAATSGINAAKDLFSKKIKKIKVKLKDEYPVLLKINR